MSSPNPKPLLQLLPQPPQPRPYKGRIISLELEDGSVLELAVAGVCNLSIREEDLQQNACTLFDGLGNVIARASFQRWRDRFNTKSKTGGAA